MATQPPQSLPSFAQAFGAPSLSRISDANNALPPIQSRASPFERNRRSPSQHDDHRQSMPHDRPTHPSRKRSHPDDSAAGDDNSPPSDDRRSPRSVRIKEETEYDALPSPTSRNPPPANPHLSPEQAAASPAPPPSAAKPSPSKKRRVTISGISHPINRSPASDAAKSISPVVMGLPIPRDDAAAIEQVRSMLSIKQQQKELIEQRRGSTAGIISVGTPPVSVNVVNAPPQGSQDRDERQQSSKSHPPARTGGRSPNAGAGSAAAAASRRSAAGNGLSATVNAPLPSRTLSPLARQASPPHHLSHRDAPPQTHILQPPPPPLPVSIAVPEQHIPANALPPPPISFARRRATRTLGGAKGKPADIMISPNADRMPPSIQSAPPIPRAGINQGGAFSRLSSMALPSLPPVLGPGQSTQRLTASRVPPTPTRLSMLRGPHTAGPSSTHLNVGSISGTGRSPPSATVPIATTLVPPTPSALANPNYTSERSAFLAPFESFYDALADSKTLKNWLGEQLQKSHNLTVTLQRQQEHLDELVAAAVERRVGPLHDEIHGLHRRIEELEYALHVQGGATAPRTSLAAVTQGPGAGYGSGSGTATGLKGKAKANGVPASSLVAESYTFPQVPEHHTHHHHHQQQQHQQQLRSGPPEQVRRALSPDRERERERDGDGRGSFPGSQGGSPVPFDVGRRLSVSAVRGEPRPVGQGRERGVLPPPPPPPQQPAGPAGGVSGWSAHGRPWSPRSARVSLPAAPSASGARHGHGQGHAGEKPGLVRRSSGYGYEESSAREREREEGVSRERERGREVGRENQRERDRDSGRESQREREREREREASPPARRDARSPERMEE